MKIGSGVDMNLNMVEVLKAVGYSENGVAGQKTRLAKLALGLTEAKDIFMFNKEEVLTMLDVVMKSKSEKAKEAGKIFDKIGKDDIEEAWIAEYVKAETVANAKTGGANKRKGSLGDLREFVEANALEEKFREFMTAKYGD